MNTLDLPRQGTKSQQIQVTTSGLRAAVHGNSPPSKKRKLDVDHARGTSATSAIALDDSQHQEESADELQLIPEEPNGEAGEQSRHKSPHVYVSLPKSNGIGVDSKQSNSQLTRSSPDDEGAFTKGSAEQRRAEKDRILASSSPGTSSTVQAGTVSSPYFDQANTPFRPPRHKALQHESPDELHTEELSQSQARPFKSKESMAQMPIRELGALIAGNGNTAPVSRAANPRIKQSNKHSKSFNLEDIIYPRLRGSDIYVVEVHTDTKTISVNTVDPMLGDDPVVHPRLISKIVEVRCGDENSQYVFLTFSRQELYEDKMLLKFESHKAVYDFVSLLQNCSGSLKVNAKRAEWMDTAFTRAKQEKQDRSCHNAPKPQIIPAVKQQAVSSQPVVVQSAKPSGEKHTRHVDRLDPPSKLLRPPTIISGAERSAAGAIYESLPRTRKQGSQENTAPPEPRNPVLQPRRITRSQDDKQAPGEHDLSETRPKRRPSEAEALKPWTTDLVYPGPGKKSATVPFDDLRRLDDDEFLNDNLISFFMQYLETYMEKNNPELYRDMYLFNTYFYETLTKNVKGRKGTNYDAVSRWTKNINIFKRRFVVVPVNENYHWYLAIICNLSYFLPKAEGDVNGKDQVDQSFQSVEDSQSSDQQSDELEKTPIAATEQTQKSLAELSISDNDDKNGQDTSKGRFKKGPGRRKTIRRSLPKYDIDKPVIITLDSLGSSRSATCSILRQYVAAEAKSKLDLDIDPTELRGMTAKQIPTQSNFSDCGLYLCMYLEQFVADPFQFVSRILQREEDAQLWPRKIRSEDLRSRLRELILELHHRQENHTPTMELPKVGSIMIEKRKPSPEPAGGSEPARKHLTKQDIAQARQRYHGIANARLGVREGVSTPAQEEAATSEPKTNPAVQPSKNSSVHAGNDDDDPIIVVQPNASRQHAHGQTKDGAALQSRDEGACAEVQVTVSPPPDTLPRRVFAHSTPAELAANLRQSNELREAKRKKRRRSNDEDDEDSDSLRKVREASASTDFLSGLNSYYVADYSPPVESAAVTKSPRLRSSPRKKGSSAREEAADSTGQHDGWYSARKRRRAEPSGHDESPRTRRPARDSGRELEVPDSQDGQENNEMLFR